MDSPYGELGEALTTAGTRSGRHSLKPPDRAAGVPDRSHGARHAGPPSRWRGCILRWPAATITAVTAIAGASLWIGPSLVIGPWDVFTLLNGGYRIYEGQSPSTDFSNPIGPLPYGLVAIGMHLEHTPSLRAVTYSQVIFLVIASALAWFISSRRLPAPYAAGFTVFEALLAVAVRPLGYWPWQMSYAMLYNRDGWLLYAPLLLFVFLPGRRTRGSLRLPVDGLLLGLTLALLFYDKITFFLAALAATVLGLAIGTLPRSIRLTGGAVAGFAVIALLTRLVFGLHVTAYVTDLARAAEVQGADQRVQMAMQILKWTSPLVLLTILLAVILFGMARRRAEPYRQVILLLIAMTYVLGSSVVISVGDATERSDLPALVVIPLFIVAYFGARLPRWAGGRTASPRLAQSGTAYKAMLAGLVLLLAGTSLPIAGKEIFGLEQATAYRGYVASPPPSQRLDGAPLNDFVIPAGSTYQTAYRESGMLPKMINNGLHLLRQNIRPGQTVFTLAYTDPFSMTLHLPLSKCGPLWWDLGYDFDALHHATASCAIGDATWVIIPRMVPGQGCCQETVSIMLSMYSHYLSRYYHRTQETSNWILLRRD